MKRNIVSSLIAIAVAVATFLCSTALAQNFLYSRFEYGRNKKTNQQYHEVYEIFETSLPSKFKTGAKIISGQKGYKMLNPFMYYCYSKEVEFGLRYSADSRENEFITPAIRLNKKLSKISIYFSYDANLNLQGGRDMPDAWFGLSIPIHNNWSYGLESRYFSLKTGNFQIRPLKVSYQFKNDFSSFLMFQRQWENSTLIKNSFFLGGIIKW